MEQRVAGELHQSRRYRTGALLYRGCTAILGCLINREKLRETSGNDPHGSPLGEDVLHAGDRTEGIRPTCIESEMRDDFRPIALQQYCSLYRHRSSAIGLCSFLGLGRNLWIGRAPIRINEDTGLFRRPAACRIHHLLDRGELYENAKLFSGICGQFPRVNE
jgi:hypothetical protein